MGRFPSLKSKAPLLAKFHRVDKNAAERKGLSDDEHSSNLPNERQSDAAKPSHGSDITHFGRTVRGAPRWAMLGVVLRFVYTVTRRFVLHTFSVPPSGSFNPG